MITLVMYYVLIAILKVATHMSKAETIAMVILGSIIWFCDNRNMFRGILYDGNGRNKQRNK